MRRRLKIASTVAIALVVLAAFALIVAYQASQQMPDFYEHALVLDAGRARETSREMVEQAAALANDLKQPGSWQVLFTAEQINGWLAVDLVENHPGTLPAEFADPRVAIEPGRASVACRYTGTGFSSVLSVEVELSLAEPNVVAIRLRRVRAGALPLPMSQVLESFQSAARSLEWPLEWRQLDGDPVALLSIPTQVTQKGRETSLHLDAVELREGEVFIAGQSQRVKQK